MRIRGIEKIHFTTKDGQLISGNRFHTGEDIPADRGVGEATDKFFLSDAKIAQLDFTPAVGMNVDVLYSRYGKVIALRLLDDVIIDL